MEIRSEILALAKRNRNLERENSYFKMRIANMQNTIKILEDKIDKLMKNLSSSITKEKNWFLYECVNNNNYFRNRNYSDKMLKFCESLFITSPKAYKLLREVIALPCKATLYERFSKLTADIKISLMKQHISDKQFLFPNYGFTEKIPIAVSINATVASPHSLFTSGNINNIFLVQIQPLSHNYKSFPISIIPSNGGRIDQNIKNMFDNILIELSNYFQVIFKCSDGDTCTNIWHNICFNHVLNLLDNPLDYIIQFIHFGKWPISDYLHIIKNMRCRLLHNLSLTPESEIISLDGFYNIFKTKTFSDKTSLAKYNDKLAINAFSIKNLKYLMNNNYLSHFYFLFPFSLWGAFLHSSKLNLVIRKKILEIMKFFMFLEYRYLDLNVSPKFQEKYFQDSERIAFYSRNKIKRIINTVIGLYYALSAFPEKLSLNRISSHPIENTFGVTRSTMQNKIGFDVFISSLSRNILHNKILDELNIQPLSYRKISDAGVFLNGNEKMNFDFNLEIVKSDILNLRQAIVSEKEYNFAHTELEKLIDGLFQDSSLDIREKDNNSISGSSIHQRNIASSYFK